MKQSHVEAINELSKEIHQDNVDAGWWTDLKTGLKKDRNVGELLMLIVSEYAEGMEGHRKNLMDDKLPHRKMLEVELADALIRTFDLAGALGLDIGGAMAEKRAFNKVRPDHKIENRLKDDGKKY
jgi:NTP pyrophosphatase (non-canonical NTP hydrolase)